MVTAAILDLAEAGAVGLAGPVGDHLPAGVLHLGARRLDRPQDGAPRQDGERGFDRFNCTASSCALICASRYARSNARPEAVDSVSMISCCSGSRPVGGGGSCADCTVDTSLSLDARWSVAMRLAKSLTLASMALLRARSLDSTSNMPPLPAFSINSAAL